MTDDAALIARLRDPVYAHKRKDELEVADRIAALTRENESLRAECGLRQIQGYNEGKAKAEAERDTAIATATIANVGLKAAVARADKAEAERDALREDAERYQWLKQCTGGEWEQMQNARFTGFGKLDAAIDAARRERKP